MLGEHGYRASDVAPKYQRWMRFCNAVLRCSSNEQFSRLLAYARDARATREQADIPFQEFLPNVSIEPTAQIVTRLPQLRGSDTTPMSPADYTAAVDALADATITAYPTRQDLSERIRQADPNRADLVQPGKRRATVDHPETGMPLVRVLTKDKKLADAFMGACADVLERFWPSTVMVSDDPPPSASATDFQSGYDWAHDAIHSGDETAETIRARVYANPDDFDRGAISYIDSLDFI